MQDGTDEAHQVTGSALQADSKPLWLTAWRDHLAGLKTIPPCLELCDLNGDGDYKLVVGDMQRKVKVFGSTCLLVEGPLLDLPVAVTAFYMDYSQDVHKPLLAIASGPFIFIYRQMRPYYKFTLPPVELSQQELDVWSKLKTDSMALEKAVEALDQLKDQGTTLSTRSMDLLSYDNEAQRRRHVDMNKNAALVQNTVITCMTVINKDREQAGGLGCLCIGTENKQLLVLDRTCSQTLKKIALPSVPVQLLASGLVDVEYRVLIMCRNGRIYITKNGELMSSVIEVETPPVALTRMENQVVVAAGSALHFYNLKGSRLSTIFLPSQVLCVCPLVQENMKNNRAICVAIGTEIRVYVGKALLNTMKMADAVVAMRVGRYSREESTLIAVLRNGSLMVFMLPRSAKLDPDATPVAGPPPEQDIPIKVPKRTTLYVEQTKRERDFCIDMHRTFQRDLCKVRLQTARAYVKVLTDSNSSLAAFSGNQLRLTAHVQGLGPLFKVKLTLQNVTAKPMTSVTCVFTYDTSLYRLSQPQMLLPLLLPNMTYNVEIPVACVETDNVPLPSQGGVVRVLVTMPHSAVPLVTLLVTIPAAEQLAL